jgi:DNA-binding protein H-NS
MNSFIKIDKIVDLDLPFIDDPIDNASEIQVIRSCDFAIYKPTEQLVNSHRHTIPIRSFQSSVERQAQKVDNIQIPPQHQKFRQVFSEIAFRDSFESSSSGEEEEQIPHPHAPQASSTPVIVKQEQQTQTEMYRMDEREQEHDYQGSHSYGKERSSNSDGRKGAGLDNAEGTPYQRINASFRPPTFHALPLENAAEFIRQFKNYIVLNNVKDMRTVVALLQSCFGELPAKWLASLKEDTKNDFDDLIQSFKNKYLNELDQFSELERLELKKQKPNESVETFVTDMMTIACKLNCDDEFIRKLIIKNLRTAIRIHVLTKRPKTLEELIRESKWAEYLESLKAEEQGQIEQKPSAEERLQSVKQTLKDSDELTKLKMTVGQLEDQMQGIQEKQSNAQVANNFSQRRKYPQPMQQQQLEQQQSYPPMPQPAPYMQRPAPFIPRQPYWQTNQLQIWQGQGRPRQQFSQPRFANNANRQQQVSGGPSSGIYCYKCGIGGHISRNCMQAQGGGPQGGGPNWTQAQQGRQGPQGCYTCGGLGHGWRNCAQGQQYVQAPLNPNAPAFKRNLNTQGRP